MFFQKRDKFKIPTINLAQYSHMQKNYMILGQLAPNFLVLYYVNCNTVATNIATCKKLGLFIDAFLNCNSEAGMWSHHKYNIILTFVARETYASVHHKLTLYSRPSRLVRIRSAGSDRTSLGLAQGLAGPGLQA